MDYFFHIRQSVWDKLKLTFEADTSSDTASIISEEKSPHNDGLRFTDIVLVKTDRNLSNATVTINDKQPLCGCVDVEYSEDPSWRLNREADFFARASERRGLGVQGAVAMALTQR